MDGMKMDCDSADPVFGDQDYKDDLNGLQEDKSKFLMDAWLKYKQFEDYTLLTFNQAKMKENQPNGTHHEEDLPFLCEFERLAASAMSAGCSYTGSILAFKLLEKSGLLDESDIQQFLTSIPYKLLFGQSSDGSVNENGLESSDTVLEIGPNSHGKDWNGEALLALVKSYLHNLISNMESSDTFGNDEMLNKEEEGDLLFEGAEDDKDILSMKLMAGDLGDLNGPDDHDSDEVQQEDLLDEDYSVKASRTSTRLKRQPRGVKRKAASMEAEESTGSPFKCEECGKEFVSRSGLLGHKRAIHQGVRYPCDKCEMSFSLKSSLQRHEKTVHTRKTYDCDECDKKFFFDVQLMQHKNFDHRGLTSMKCDDCDSEFPDAKSMQEHTKKEHGLKYSCDECDKVYFHKGNLREHKRSVHQGVKRTCEECGKVFSAIYQYHRHKKHKHSDKALELTRVCDKCGKKFDNQMALNQHKRKVHEFKNYYSCSLCDYAGKDSVELKAHVTTKHEGKLLPCTKCNFEASSLFYLYQHRAQHHNNKPPKLKDNSKPRSRKVYKCDECGLEAKSLHWLQVHKESKHKGIKYQCHICNAQLSNKLILKNHMAARHGNSQHVCDKCGHVVKSKDRLQQHHRTVHERRYHTPCDQCDYMAPNPTVLKIHVMTKHQGVTFPCDQCDFTAPHPKSLKRHKEINHDLKRYHCDQCDYMAKDKELLTIHTQTKHEGVQFPCDECEMKFSTKPTLKKHKSTKHSREMIMTLI